MNFKNDTPVILEIQPQNWLKNEIFTYFIAVQKNLLIHVSYINCVTVFYQDHVNSRLGLGENTV